MKVIWKIWYLLILVSFVFSVSERAFAQDLKILTTTEPLFLKNSDNSENQTIEPSAASPIGNGKFLLVADDKDDGKGNSLKIIEVSTRKILKTLQKFQPSKKNPKWEALAKDETGNYYLIGSHNNADAEKLAARSLMFRFRLKNEAEQDAEKIEIATDSVRELDVKESLTALQLYSPNPPDNTVKIEGLAVRKNGGQQQLIVGFRLPSCRVKVYFAVIPNDSSENKAIIKLSLKPLFQFNAGETADNTLFQLSSIEYVQDLKGFFVLTSTETADAAGKPVFHGNALWFVSDKSIQPLRSAVFTDSDKLVPAKKILDFQPLLKAEGICLLSKDQKTFRLAIVFDNDAEDTKVGGKIQLIDLSTAQS
jgi:hypothetical protein